jgi:hypothetical protein
MDNQTKHLLARWKALKDDDGLQRAGSAARVLWFVGLALSLFVIFVILYPLHPAMIAIAATAMGWVVAESNALRTRSTQWPIFCQYLDWQRVQQDLKNEKTET